MDKNLTTKVDNNPLVSVIIAVHNGAFYVDECLSSIVNQTYNNIEIIVCDDASDDNSFELLKKWEKRDPRIVVLQNQTNLFAGATRNKCFKHANGKYFCLQDIDDVSHRDRIERLVAEMINENVDFVSSAMEMFEISPSTIIGVMKQRRKYPQKKNFLWGISFNHPATLFSRKCIESIDGYRISEETRRCEDYDLFMRLYQHGFKGKNIDEVLYSYRYDKQTVLRGASKSSIKGEYNVRKRNFKIFNYPPPVRILFAMKPVVSFLIARIRAARL